MKRATPEFPQIPEKSYFRIGEVSNLVGVDAHVLRYWETEFTVIKPYRGKSKQRLYRRQDVESLLRIKGLLHDEGYTISGARKFLKSQKTRATAAALAGENPALKGDQGQVLGMIKGELQAILAIFDGKGDPGTT